MTLDAGERYQFEHWARYLWALAMDSPTKEGVKLKALSRRFFNISKGAPITTRANDRRPKVPDQPAKPEVPSEAHRARPWHEVRRVGS